jgi:hypothetical protein
VSLATGLLLRPANATERAAQGPKVRSNVYEREGQMVVVAGLEINRPRDLDFAA